MEPSPVPQEEHVPLKSRVWVSAADAASAMLLALSVNGSLTYYFTRWQGLDPELAQIVWLLFGIWNAVNDPLFGYLSDRTRSRLGRRRPYIRYGAPLFGLSFLAFWLHIPNASQTVLFAQLFLTLFVFDTLYTAIATSLYVMPFEMALSNKARSGILVWKLIFAAFPLAIPLVLLPMIQPGPGDDAFVFQMVMTAFGLGMAVVIFLSTYFYEEKAYTQQETQPPFFVALRECFKNRSFLFFETISFTVIFDQTARVQGVLYYVDEIAVPMGPAYAALGVGVVAGVLLFVRQREAWGVKLSVRIMALVFSIGCFVILLFGRLLVPALVGFFCFGVGFSGGMYLIPLMNGDVVDMDEHRTGLRREGMYAGVNSFITKPAISLAQAVFLWFLTRYGYDQTLAKGAQTAAAETGILMGWSFATGVLLFLCFVVLYWYPLSGPAWEQIKQELLAVHARKEHWLH